MKPSLDAAIRSTTITEGFVNLVNNRLAKGEWANRVWNILQDSYAVIGGIKGSGFESIDDMVSNIPFWKVYHVNGKVQVVVMYKDKAGRKVVACGTDGSPKSKKMLAGIMRNDLGVSWGELSKAALVFMMKNPWNVVAPYVLDLATVRKQLPDDDIQEVTPSLLAKLDATDQRVYDRYKGKLHPYFYIREIGGEPKLKASFGTAEKTII